MFEKNRPKYETKGINTKLPLGVRVLLWGIIETVSNEVKLDYLQIFQLEREGNNMLKITHSQEVPQYEKVYIFPISEGNVEGKIFVIDDETHCTMLLADEYQKGVNNMWYVLGGMTVGIAVVAMAECFIEKYVQKGAVRGGKCDIILARIHINSRSI